MSENDPAKLDGPKVLSNEMTFEIGGGEAGCPATVTINWGGIKFEESGENTGAVLASMYQGIIDWASDAMYRTMGPSP